MIDLDSGIPSMEAYKACNATPLFRDMEGYSETFLRRHRRHLFYYSLRWSHDPLHHPTRQWEYPYTYERLSRRPFASVLDAGSGVTFFPYYLMDRRDNLRVTCCDQDAGLAKVYEEINQAESNQVEFQQSELSKLPFQDASFDALYCISVLEHTKNYDRIIEEFRRVLVPGGRLVVTFDISLDGRKEIPLAEAEDLLMSLARVFKPVDAPILDVANQDIYTSATDLESASQFSWWTVYRRGVQAAKAMWRDGRPRPSVMTFYCAEYGCHI